MQTESKTIERPMGRAGAGARPSSLGVPGRLTPLPAGAREHAGRVLATLRRYPELALFALLLLLTSTLSRSFSQDVSVGPVYVTEVVMAVSFAIAAGRLGARSSVATLRRLPLPALAVIWFVGAIATLRGLEEFGLSMVENDVGLAHYTLLLPLLALIAADRERHEALFSVLVACGFAGMATFLAVFTADQISGHAETLFNLQGSAAALYMSMAVAWIAARLVNGVPTPPALIALLPAGLVLMALTGQRSSWMVAFLSLSAVALLAPGGRRLRAGLAVAVVVPLSIVAALGIQSVLAEVAPAESTAGAPLDPVLVDPTVPASDQVAVTGGGESRGQQNLSTTADGGGPQLEQEIVNFADPTAPEGQNVRWRLEYWRSILSRVPDAPLLGAGFGRPAEFYWDNRKYDFRDGAPLAGIDVAGPHNSFVNFLWRLGIPAFLALLFVIGVALARVRRALHAGLEARERVALTTLVAMLAAGAMASSFNEGLTGPFLGLFFWVPLGMLLLWPATRSGGAAERTAA